ncbi:shikimate kinase AroK [Pelomicrobium sp. G1]|uniref:shikimate kinase AroK n=1 Tax=unclassified Pelomicrobium TaxID=2815318 RepID=UPI003F76FEAC
MLPSRNIFLVGMMGAGKSTVGKLLARHLGKTFLDTDHEIRRRTGVEIPVIFEIEGEEGFRAREAAVLRELTQREDVVLATGGGAVLRPENRALLKARGAVIYLRGSVEELWARTLHDRNRPLLQTADPKARLDELLRERDPLYREVADLVVDTGRAGALALVRRIEKRLREAERTQAKDALELDTDA